VDGWGVEGGEQQQPPTSDDFAGETRELARELNPRPDVAGRPQKFRRLPSANVYVEIAAETFTVADTRRAGLTRGLGATGRGKTLRGLNAP